MNKKELAEDYFSRHEMSNECYITSDGRVFHTKGMAESFANDLEDKEVEKYTRDVLPSEESTLIDEDELLAKTALLETTELVKENYKILKELVKYFKIEVLDQKAETLIEAISTYKAKIQEG